MGTADSGRTALRLSEVFDRTPAESLAIEDARLIVFSDHHRGQGDGADDFKRCRRAYHAALGHYLEAGYRLCLLGDVEELWECFAGPALRAYADTLALEREFHQAGRYLRVFGNHDDLWADQRMVRRYLAPTFAGLEVREAVRFLVTRDGRPMGTLFLVHGHQGTFDGERFAWLFRPFVRYVWRNLQRLTRLRVNSPATDYVLRREQERSAYEWVAGRAGTVLIAGHTHRPVFQSLANATRLERELAGVRARLGASPGDPALKVQAAALRAELEWVKVADGAGAGPVALKPCYFNSGCCCFDDGDLTGIEIADGAIRLVRWPDDEGNPKPSVLASADLAQVFAVLG